MQGLIFMQGTEVVEVRIDGKQIWFRTSSYGSQFADIENLNLNYSGAIKEFPDLEGEKEWRKEAIKRFKDKIASMENEDEIATYIIEDLKRFGYIPKYRQRQGFRPERIK